MPIKVNPSRPHYRPLVLSTNYLGILRLATSANT